uniref:Uncharacterized protein n=1 Tax=Cacopsylla melanoneura TaxID=428564 RepID=A0A8D8QQV7_9HEMI
MVLSIWSSIVRSAVVLPLLAPYNISFDYFLPFFLVLWFPRILFFDSVCFLVCSFSFGFTFSFTCDSTSFLSSDSCHSTPFTNILSFFNIACFPSFLICIIFGISSFRLSITSFV